MLDASPLGHNTPYEMVYNPKLLFPVPRALGREKIELKLPLPFDGVDQWTGYELSWLNAKGKPEIALAEFHFPCTSPNIIESKSFKLYLNSFNQTRYESFEQVCQTIHHDLSQVVQSNIGVRLVPLHDVKERRLGSFVGTCVDDLDIECDTYDVDSTLLSIESDEQVDEVLYSNLFKSNCLATGQPDWGSLFIRYEGKKIDRESFLKYVVSYRNHSGFAEHCVEQIFCDLMAQCHPEKLSVYARYTRRGGLDINPFRSNFEKAPLNIGLIRQ